MAPTNIHGVGRKKKRIRNPVVDIEAEDLVVGEISVVQAVDVGVKENSETQKKNFQLSQARIVVNLKRSFRHTNPLRLLLERISLRNDEEVATIPEIRKEEGMTIWVIVFPTLAEVEAVVGEVGDAVMNILIEIVTQIEGMAMNHQSKVMVLKDHRTEGQT